MRIRLDHIAVAVADIKAAVEDFEGRLGLGCQKVESVPSEKATVAFFDLGGPHLELVAPEDPGSAIARSIEKRGEGLHHICLEVEDLDKVLLALKAKGVQLVKEQPTIGAGGRRISFVHPKSMHGVLIELVEGS